MLGWATNTLKKSEAAVLVQQAFDHHILSGMKPFDTGKVSNSLVSMVWDQKPDLFEGKLGKRPHKMSIAAIALAQGLSEFEGDSAAQSAVLLALGAVLIEIENNGRFYDLRGADEWMIEKAVQAYASLSKAKGWSGSADESFPSSRSGPLQPDMASAAKSYAHIALMRMNNSEADLHEVLQKRAKSMRAKGDAEHQVLSALWGGIYGIDVDLNTVRSSIKDYQDALEETKRSLGYSPEQKAPSSFEMAATLHLALVMADKPDEFERYLSHVRS